MNLDKIIRRIDSENDRLSDEIVLLVDAKKKRVLPKPPSLWQMVTISYYAVSTVKTAVCNGVSHRFGDILLKISFRVSSIPDREAEAVEALLQEDANNLEDALNKRIRRILKQYIDENGYQNTVPKSITDLKNFIKSSAITELGLNLIATIEIDGDTAIDRIQSGNFDVRVEDNLLGVSYELEYETIDWVRKTSNPDAYLSLEKTLISAIQQFALKETKLHHWVYEFDERVKSTLASIVEKELMELGLKSRYFTFNNSTARTIAPRETTVKITSRLACKIEEYNELVQVHVEVILRIIDIGRFKRANISGDFKSWYESKIITPIVEGRLFKMTYRSFLLDITEIRASIVRQIAEETNKIGYNVEYQLFFPEIPKLRFVSDGFVFEDITNSFKTKDNNVDIPLLITVKGRIANLNTLDERYLNPNVDLEAEIKNSVIDVVADVMYKEEAEEVYMRFDHNNNRETVKERAINAIRNALREKFKVRDDSLTVLIHTGKNHLSSKVGRLTGTEYRFSVNFLPRDSETRTINLEYLFTYKVWGVRQDGWVIFKNYADRSAEDEVSAITNLLKERIIAILRQIEYDLHVSHSFEVKQGIAAKIDETFNHVGQEYGLLLQVMSKDRSPSLLELQRAYINEGEIKGQTARPSLDMQYEIDNNIKKLELLWLEKNSEGWPEDDLKEIQERIDRLKEKRKMYLESGNMFSAPRSISNSQAEILNIPEHLKNRPNE